MKKHTIQADDFSHDGRLILLATTGEKINSASKILMEDKVKRGMLMVYWVIEVEVVDVSIRCIELLTYCWYLWLIPFCCAPELQVRAATNVRRACAGEARAMTNHDSELRLGVDTHVNSCSLIS
jgi:hypothetical protein